MSDTAFRPAAILLKNRKPDQAFEAGKPETGVSGLQPGASDTAPENNLESRLLRLVALQGSDPGFYLLAVHSFIESYLRDRYELYTERETFPDLLYYYKKEVLAGTDGHVPLIATLDEIAHSRRLANAVRHQFLRLDPEEAVAATSVTEV